MARTSIRWNLRAFEEIRREPGVEDELQGVVDRVLADLPLGHDHYGAGVESGRSRSRAYVVTATGEAMRAEAESNDLVRALGGAHL